MTEGTFHRLAEAGAELARMSTRRRRSLRRRRVQSARHERRAMKAYRRAIREGVMR